MKVNDRNKQIYIYNFIPKNNNSHQIVKHADKGLGTQTMHTTKIILKTMLPGMIKNNVDFCYKKVASHHRLIKAIPFRFRNRIDQKIRFLH